MLKMSIESVTVVDLGCGAVNCLLLVYECVQVNGSMSIC